MVLVMPAEAADILDECERRWGVSKSLIIAGLSEFLRLPELARSVESRAGASQPSCIKFTIPAVMTK